MRQSLKGKDTDWSWQRSSTWHQRTPVPFSARLRVQQVERQPWAILSGLLSKVFSWSESLNMSLSKVRGLSVLNFEYNNLLLSTALYLKSWNICNFLFNFVGRWGDKLTFYHGWNRCLILLFCLFFYRSVTEAAGLFGMDTLMNIVQKAFQEHHFALFWLNEVNGSKIFFTIFYITATSLMFHHRV